jgi:hypothetical protein
MFTKRGLASLFFFKFIMRKIPLYTLIQELMMQWMMLLLILGYIVYDFMDLLNELSYILIGIIGILFLLSLKKMMGNFVLVTIQPIFMLPSKKDLYKNYSYTILFNLILGIATALHFYLRYTFQKDLTPLFWEYGLGGIIGVALQLFIKRKPLFGITKRGLAIGSQYDLKLVEWKNIECVDSLENHFSIQFIKNFPLKKLLLAKNSKTIDLKKLIENNIQSK